MRYSIMNIGIKYVTLISLSFAPYMLSLGGEFVFDDSEAIINNKDIDLTQSYTNIFYHDFWGSDINATTSHKSYRPLTILTFRFNRQLDHGKLVPSNFKITNLLLHILVTIIVYNFFQIIKQNYKKSYELVSTNKHSGSSCKEIIKHESTPSSVWKDEPFLSSILFAVHPIHVEAVSGIVGRADILAALFFFLSFIFYDKSIRSNNDKYKLSKCLYFSLSILFAILATLSKETGITVLAICSIHDILNNFNMHNFIIKKNKLINDDVNIVPKSQEENTNNEVAKYKYVHRALIIRQFIVSIVVLLLLYERLAIMGFEKPQFQETDNPAAFSESLMNRIATYNYLYFINLLIMIWPQWLCFDWSMGCIPILNGLHDFRLIFVILIWIYFLITIYKIFLEYSKQYNVSYYIMIYCIIIIPFLPASNIIMPVGFVIAERILYIPSVGFCAIIVNGYRKICKFLNLKYRKLANLFFIMLILIMAKRTVQRSNEWLNENLLYNSGLEVCPNNAKVHYNIGKNAGDNNRLNIAEEKYKEAIRLNPAYYQAMNNLANLFKDQNRFTEAELLLKNAIQIKNDFPAAWMNLGIVLANMNRPIESENAYINALKYRKKYADCYYNLGNLYLDQKKHEMALNSWFEATKINPQHAVSWSNILALLDNTGQIERALKLAPSVLSILPNVPAIHFNFANLLGKNNDFVNAEKHFLKAIDLKKNQPSAIYFANLGVLYHRWKKLNDATENYKKALKIDPLLKSAKDNLHKITRQKQ